MDGTIFFVLLVLILLGFTCIVPFFLYAGMKKITDPVLFWLPLSISAAVLLIFAAVLQFRVIDTTDPLAGTLSMVSLLLLVNACAIISPFPLFEPEILADSPAMIFPLLSLAGLYLLFIASLGESLQGGPLPAFSQLLPVTGWAIDGAAAILNLQGIAYAPALQIHTIILAIGLYLEVFILSGIFYAVLAKFSPRRDA